MNKIIVDIGIKENRIAIIENDDLAELYVEREDDKKLSGNIYKGKVVNVLPGMEAAFVDIGLQKNAFLYLKDAIPVELLRANRGKAEELCITDVVRKGEEIVVQIVKEPFESKGARITRYLSIPGRYVVLMPFNSYIGVSRKISSEEERVRLKKLVEKILPKGMGCIIRTVSKGLSKLELEADINFLINTFEKLNAESKLKKAPSLLYRELDIIQRMARDYIDSSVDSIVVNDRDKYEEIKEITGLISAEYENKIEYFDESHDIFGFLGVEKMIKNAINRTVVLENGGHIVIDETEALTSIDVNTGKFIGNRDLDDTIVRMNMEAAVEIAKQIRLRNIGGIIIIDFIDMKERRDEQAVIEALEASLEKDRTKTNVLGMTRLGLVEMTRKKSSSRLTSRLLRNCPYCNGNGKINSEEVVVTNIQNEVKRAHRNTTVESILFEINPLVNDYIKEKKHEFEKVLKENFNIEIILKENRDIFFDELKIVRMGSKGYVESYIREKY